MTAHARNDAQLARQCLAGFVGGLVGALAMNLFSRVVTAAGDGREGPGAAPGWDRVGRGVQPAQAEARADDDATIRVGNAAYQAVTGRCPPRPTRFRLGTAVHYAFGGTVGVCYTILSRRLSLLRMGRGLVYGTAVWLVADETIMPALGLSRGPRRLSAGVHAYALAGHLVYGLALDATARRGSGSVPLR